MVPIITDDVACLDVSMALEETLGGVEDVPSGGTSSPNGNEFGRPCSQSLMCCMNNGDTLQFSQTITEGYTRQEGHLYLRPPRRRQTEQYKGVGLGMSGFVCSPGGGALR